MNWFISIITAAIAYFGATASAHINNDHTWDQKKSELESELSEERLSMQNDFNDKLTVKKARLDQSTKFIEKSFEIHEKLYSDLAEYFRNVNNSRIPELYEKISIPQLEDWEKYSPQSVYVSSKMTETFFNVFDEIREFQKVSRSVWYDTAEAFNHPERKQDQYTIKLNYRLSSKRDTYERNCQIHLDKLRNSIRSEFMLDS